jgi:uncharacterized protein (DUF1919 family)
MSLYKKLRSKARIWRKQNELKKRKKQFKREIKNREFSIICNNCWAGHIYQQLGIQYKTPTVGMFFFAECYLKFIANLKENLTKEIRFVERSKYKEANFIIEQKGPYPIGVIDDFEIQFLHYKTPEEAAKKWKERAARVDFNNLYTVFSERDVCTKEHLEAFERIKLPNKVCFTAHDYPELKSTVWIKDYDHQKYIGDIFTENTLIDKYFNVAQWLNKNEIEQANNS